MSEPSELNFYQLKERYTLVKTPRILDDRLCNELRI